MGFMDVYNTYMYELSDSRTKDWPLVQTPIPFLLISIAYLYFVLRCGPRFMEKRQPYSLLTFTRYYNVFQVIANAGFIYKLYQINWFRDYGFICRNNIYGTDPQSMQIASLAWWILLLKLTDYAETIVFVLRKRQRQVSFLHVYHHVSTAFLCWVIVKYQANGSPMCLTMINSAVHVVMYTYYYLSTFGPSVQQMIASFKRYVTIIQIVQFVILFIFASQGFLPYCPINSILVVIAQANIILNFYLFYDFYQKTYVKPKRK